MYGENCEFAEFNLKVPCNVKDCIAKFPRFTALCRHFGAVIVEIVEILLRELLLKAQFNLVPANMMNNHDLHPVPSGKCSDLPGF